MSDKNEISLQVDGKEYTSWTTARITRSIEAAAGSLTLIEPTDPENYDLREGSECRVSIGGEPVITGYIDEVALSLNDTGFTVTVEGRDKTADLIDCSAVGKSEVRNKSLIQIARELCQPFGISVLTEQGTDAEISLRLNPKAARSVAQRARRRKEKASSFAGENIGTFRSQPGETVLAALERVAKEKGLLITSTASGELLFTRTGKESSGATIKEGENFLAGNSTISLKERFSDYVVNGQQSGAEGLNGNRWKAFKATAKDINVKRFRPLVILAENAMGASGARRRASWEATVRAAKSISFSCTVPEFRNEKGALWKVNTLAKVEVPSLRVKREMLITEVSFEIGDGGRVTSLQFKRPDAFLLESEVPLQSQEPVSPSKPPIKNKTKRQRRKPKAAGISRELLK
jgi:prophage tail gpP-like protein